MTRTWHDLLCERRDGAGHCSCKARQEAAIAPLRRTQWRCDECGGMYPLDHRMPFSSAHKTGKRYGPTGVRLLEAARARQRAQQACTT